MAKMGRPRKPVSNEPSIPNILNRNTVGRPITIQIAEPNHGKGARYTFAHRKRMFELYCRSGGSISYVVKRTGVNRNTVGRLATKFKWDSRMRKVAEAAEEMSDSALAREMSLATREEIHTFDRVERDLLELMTSKKARKYVSYEKLAALLLRVSERRLLLRNPMPVKKTNQRESQPALPPGSEEETTTLKIEIERQMKRVGKLAREAGMSEEDLEGLDTKKAIDVPASDYEVTKDDEKKE